MKLIIAILILASFLQTTILPVDLVILILIIRTFITHNKSNLYLAFFIGLLISHLSLLPLGIVSLLYILMVQSTTMVSKIRTLHSTFLLVPILLILLIINSIAMSIMVGQSLVFWPRIFYDALFAVPIYLLLILWEERFVVKQNVKLRV